MIHVHLTFELPEDEYGPREIGTEIVQLPQWFASDARQAHVRILSLLSKTDYFELPVRGGGAIPVTSSWVRRVVVRPSCAHD